MLDRLDIRAAVAQARELAKTPRIVPVANVEFSRLESGVWVVRQVPKPRIRRSEEDEQSDLFRWLRSAGRGYVAHSVPNDASSDPERIGALKRTGLTPGAPDLYVFGPGGNLAIEMKTPQGKLSDLKPHQEGFLATLAGLPGWNACVCFGYVAALAAIERWMEIRNETVAVETKA